MGEGNGNPLQCSCLENPRDGGAWWAAIYGVTQESDMTEATEHTLLLLAALPVSACREAQPLAQQPLLRIVTSL